ncbi:MAG: substrate-binding domain-containing protein, partial [Caldimicrobium sp.]
MKKLMVLFVSIFLFFAFFPFKSKAEGLKGTGKIINGAGATFPYPLYSAWANDYYKDTGLKINYQSIGSGGGIRQITERTVDFGASDMPLKPEE